MRDKRRRKRTKAERANIRQRRMPIPLEHYGGPITRQQRMLALYGPLARELGAKLTKFREARGWAQSTAAVKLGVRLSVYKRLEAGQIMIHPELQRRVIEVYFKQIDRSKTPTMPALPRWKARTDQRVSMRWFDPELWERTKKFALTNGVSMSAVVAAALERLLLDEPALVTIQAALKVAEKLRTESILAANPDLVYILQGDPQVVKLAALVEPIPAEHHPSMKTWSALWDGPASPVAADELMQGVLAPRRKTDEEAS